MVFARCWWRFVIHLTLLVCFGRTSSRQQFIGRVSWTTKYKRKLWLTSFSNCRWRCKNRAKRIPHTMHWLHRTRSSIVRTTRIGFLEVLQMKLIRRTLITANKRFVCCLRIFACSLSLLQFLPAAHSFRTFHFGMVWIEQKWMNHDKNCTSFGLEPHELPVFAFASRDEVFQSFLVSAK